MRDNFCEKVYLIILFLLLFTTLYAQKNRLSPADSLLTQLQSAKKDTARVNILSIIVEELRSQGSISKALPYAEQMISICEKNLVKVKDPASIFIFLKAKAKGYNTLGSYQASTQGNYDEGFKFHYKAIEIQKNIGAKSDLAESYFRIGNIYRQIKNFDLAIEHYLNNLKLVSELNEKQKIIQAYKWIGAMYSLKSNNQLALKYFNLWLKYSEEINDKKSIADAHTDIGIYYQNLGDYELALKHFSISIKSHQEWMTENKITENTNSIADCYHNISIVNYLTGNYLLSLKNALLALKIREQTNNEKGTAIEKMLIGGSYFQQENYSEALISYKDALLHLEKFKDKYFIADCYFNIGQVYSFQDKNSEAIDNTLQALKLSEELKDKSRMSHAYIVLANIYMNDRKFSEAMKFCFKGLELIEQTGEKAALADLKATLGSIYMAFPDSLILAKQYVSEAYLIYKQIGQKDQFKEYFKNLAEINFRQQNYKEAYEDYRHFMVYQDSTSSKQLSEKLTQLRMQYEFDKKETAAKSEEEKRLAEQKLQFDNQKALQALAISKQKSLLLEQSLLAEQKENELTQLNQRKVIQDLELEKNKNTLKQQQLLLASQNKNLQLLNKDKTLQSTLISKEKSNRNFLIAGFVCLLALAGGFFYAYNQKRKLVFSKQVSEVEMKALRAQMNPHFIFNSLSSIHSLIQSNNQKAASAYLLQFSKFTRVVLENSLKQYISLADELEALKLYIDLENLRMDKKLSYDLTVEEGIDEESILIPPFILQPFLENAILHGLQHKDGSGKITVCVSRHNEMLKCVIADNGIGMIRSKELRTGYFAAKKESLGMKIVEQRISIINKINKSNAYVAVHDIKDENHEISGVRVEVMLPMEQKF